MEQSERPGEVWSRERRIVDGAWRAWVFAETSERGCVWIDWERRDAFAMMGCRAWNRGWIPIRRSGKEELESGCRTERKVSIVSRRYVSSCSGSRLPVRYERFVCRSTSNAPKDSKDAVESPPSALVLLAGGIGKRMGASVPKQYLPLLGKPIALHSFDTFLALDFIVEVIVVCEEEYRPIFLEHAETSKAAVPIKFAPPGKERQDSVFNGLSRIDAGRKLVCIHDSARPLVTRQEIEDVVRDASLHGAAVLGVACKPTVKEVDPHGFVIKTLDRSKLWEMQTPQVIEPGLLRKGFDHVQAHSLEVTDDVSIVEHLGLPVKVTQGRYTNIKVTTPDDMFIAERFLQEASVVG